MPRPQRLHRSRLRTGKPRLGRNELGLAENLRGLALVSAKQGRREEAERFYHRVLAIQEEKLGRTHGDVADTLEALADVLADDRRAEAEALRDRSNIIRHTDPPVFLRGLRPGLRLVPPAAFAPGQPPRRLAP